MFRNFKGVPYIIFGRGCFNQLDEIINQQCRLGSLSTVAVFLVDDVFKKTVFSERIVFHNNDLLIWVNVDDEPKTKYVDDLTLQIKQHMFSLGLKNPCVVVGIGGGSTMDLAKAVSLMLTNIGSSEDYQGWDLIKNSAIYHVAVPTLSGTGSEVSKTTVLTGPKKKLGINSDYTVFDQIILDPELIESVPKLQRFYTGMDCYIHCVEALNGNYINAFSKAYGQKALELCLEVFLKIEEKVDDKLMMASYFGGMSIVYSQVGICHALSYGLSFVLGIHHGLANCVIFNVLDKYYPNEVFKFREMMDKQEITLPKELVSNLPDKKIEEMIRVALVLEPLWENTFGENWKNYITQAELKKIYLRI